MHGLRTLTLAVAMLGGADASAESLRYLALGDSYSIGEAVAAAERWPQQLVQLLRREGLQMADPAIVARTGWTGDELALALDRAERGQSLASDGNGAALRPPYDLVSLLIGVNNQYRGRPVEEFADQFRSLLQRAIGYADGRVERVIVVSIPDWGHTPFATAKSADREQVSQQIDAYNRVKSAQCAALGIVYIDITDGSRAALQDASLVAPDGLHPSALEYERWAAAVFPAARAALAR